MNVAWDYRKQRQDTYHICGRDREMRVTEYDEILHCSKKFLNFILSFAVRKDSVSVADACL